MGECMSWLRLERKDGSHPNRTDIELLALQIEKVKLFMCLTREKQKEFPDLDFYFNGIFPDLGFNQKINVVGNQITFTAETSHLTSWENLASFILFNSSLKISDDGNHSIGPDHRGCCIQ